jgi:hypothetical protein
MDVDRVIMSTGELESEWAGKKPLEPYTTKKIYYAMTNYSF